MIELEVTDERTRDCQKAKRLVEGAKKKAKGKRVSKVIADKGYDAHEFFRYLGKEGIEAAVLVRKGAKIRGNAVRDTVVRAMRRGKRRWKEYMEYSKRREIVFKVAIVNIFLAMGML